MLYQHGLKALNDRGDVLYRKVGDNIVEGEKQPCRLSEAASGLVGVINYC